VACLPQNKNSKIKIINNQKNMYMKAADARRLALTKNISQSDSQYANIIDVVSKAARKGNYEMWWYENMNDDVRTKLTQDGFTVGQAQFDRNETLIKIEWKQIM
jgi:hypothetical protein